MRRLLLALTALALLALAAHPRAEAGASDGPLRAAAFLDRVFARVPATLTQEYVFQAWDHGGQPTQEGFGLLRVSQPLDPEKVVARIMDVDRYKQNLKRLELCHSVPDSRFKPPQSVRMKMLVDIEPVGKIQHELAMIDGGSRQGYRVVYWYDLQPETSRLDPSVGARSAYSVGMWFVNANAIGYAVSNAPVEQDVNAVQWGLMTGGADMMAKTVAKNNIDGMVAWSRR